MAHLITGNKFDPDKDIPDLSGKVSLLPKTTFHSHSHTTALTILTRSMSSLVVQQELALEYQHIF